jgi:hypothetical protein
VTVYLTITTTTASGPETSLAAVRDASQVEATIRAVLAARVRQARREPCPACCEAEEDAAGCGICEYTGTCVDISRWATIAVYDSLGTDCGRQWAEEVIG